MQETMIIKDDNNSILQALNRETFASFKENLMATRFNDVRTGSAKQVTRLCKGMADDLLDELRTLYENGSIHEIKTVLRLYIDILEGMYTDI